MNIKNRAGFRYCARCKTEKELNSDNFCKDKNREGGFSYRCKPCDHIYGVAKYKINPRKDRYSKMTDTEKKARLVWANKYRKTLNGRSIAHLKAYQHYDKSKNLYCDLTKEFVKAIMIQPCIYCGEPDMNKIGCDRVDNSVGHVMSNIVPCCGLCNVTRSNNFSFDEMKVIGSTIKEIRLARYNEKLSAVV